MSRLCSDMWAITLDNLINELDATELSGLSPANIPLGSLAGIHFEETSVRT